MLIFFFFELQRVPHLSGDLLRPPCGTTRQTTTKPVPWSSSHPSRGAIQYNNVISIPLIPAWSRSVISSSNMTSSKKPLCATLLWCTPKGVVDPQDYCDLHCNLKLLCTFVVTLLVSGKRDKSRIKLSTDAISSRSDSGSEKNVQRRWFTFDIIALTLIIMSPYLQPQSSLNCFPGSNSAAFNERCIYWTESGSNLGLLKWPRMIRSTCNPQIKKELKTNLRRHQKSFRMSLVSFPLASDKSHPLDLTFGPLDLWHVYWTHMDRVIN